jgi:hypothetical protein
LEASGSFKFQLPRKARGAGAPPPEGRAVDDEVRKERSREVASRRAASRLRRYAVANRLNRLGTLTYAESCTDPRRARADIGDFFRNLREAMGKSFPYVWVPEWHPGGHGLHLHFAVNRFIRHGTIKEAWGRGIVDIRRREPQRLGGGQVDESRQTARYLAKYVRKGMDDESRPKNLHRFDCAQGFRPEVELVHGAKQVDVIEAAADRMGGWPSVVWRSQDMEQGWFGPPALWLQWNG